MKVVSLSSGSKGNAYLLKSNNYYYLIDIGVSFTYLRRTLSYLSVEMKSIKGLFVTHEHSDHVKGLISILKNLNLFSENFQIFITKGTIQGLKLDPEYKKILFKRVKIISSFEVLRLKDFRVFIISKSHDAKEPVNLFFENGQKIGFFTDFGYVDNLNYDFIKKADILFLEANFCEDILLQGNFNFFYSNRLISDLGHLSVQDCIILLNRIDKDVGIENKKIILSHISENSNTYYNAYFKVKNALKMGFKNKQGDLNDFKFENECKILNIAFQNEVSDWFS